MLFGLAASDEGRWFPFFTSQVGENGTVAYDDPKPDALRVCIRPLGPFFEERNKARKRRSEFVLNPTTRTMERVTYVPDLKAEEQQAESDDAWDYAIMGVRDAQGNAVEFSRADKLEHMKHPVFARFVGRCLQLIASDEAVTEEALRKN